MATMQLVHEYNDGKVDRRIVMTARTRVGLTMAAFADELADKKGEEFIKALLLLARGDISKVERYYMEGLQREPLNHRDDGPNGEAAVQLIDKNGNIYHETHYDEGEIVKGPAADFNKSSMKLGPLTPDEKALIGKKKDDFVKKVFANKLEIRRLK